MVRLVRLLAFGLIVASVSLAQYLYATLSLADLIPTWLVAHSPFFAHLARWSPEDQLILAHWLTLISLLGFGLITPWWHGERGRYYRRLPTQPGSARRLWWGTWIVAVLAFCLAGAAAAAGWQGRSGLTVTVLWLAAVIAYLPAGLLASWARPAVVYADSYVENVRPWSSWPWLVVMLVVFGALYSYRLIDLPARIDPAVAQVGLTASAWLRSGDGSLFATTAWGLPRLTLKLPALLLLLGFDGLLAVRLAGVVAALALLVGMWAVGCELFRRVPLQGAYGEGVEDDGRWPALMGAMALGVALPVLFLARMPLMLDPVAWGVWALWALLRGLRRDRPHLLGLSAAFGGLALLYGATGLLMVMGCLIAWGAILLLERSWLAGKMVARTRSGEAVRVQRGVGWRGFAYWIAGLGVLIAPLIGHWLALPQAWVAHWRWSSLPLPMDAVAVPTSFLDRLAVTLLGLNHYSDLSGITLAGSPFLQSLFVPVAILAVGALLLNIDSLIGWFLTIWLTAALVILTLTTPLLPYWPAYVVLLPPLSLAIAFGLDRMRLLFLTTLGTWSFQATVYLALGILVAAGFVGWVQFYSDAHQGVDVASSMARALRGAGTAQVTVLNGNVMLSPLLESPAVQLAAGSTATRVNVADLDALPEQSPGARILISPEDWIHLGDVMRAYPGGALTAVRDLRANPLIYIYDLPTAVTTVDD